MSFKWSTLGELSIGGGKYGISAPAVEFDRNLPAYLRITDINDDGSLNLSGRKSVADPLAFDYMLQEGDIVFARTGSSTGRNYYYDLRDGDFAFAGFLIKFSLDKEKVNPRFIKYYAILGLGLFVQYGQHQRQHQRKNIRTDACAFAGSRCSRCNSLSL